MYAFIYIYTIYYYTLYVSVLNTGVNCLKDELWSDLGLLWPHNVRRVSANVSRCITVINEGLPDVLRHCHYQKIYNHSETLLWIVELFIARLMDNDNGVTAEAKAAAFL